VAVINEIILQKLIRKEFDKAEINGFDFTAK
jgi:hypothetical protein